MSSGHSLSIPFYDGVQGSGVFASLCTVLIQKTPSTCSFEPAASYVRTHAAMMYVDPPTQFVNVADACNWGRIVVDTGWTRYDFAPLRTGSHRLAANIVVYLLNIERCMERTASSGGDGYAPQSCGVPTASSDIAGQTHQVVGCSSGDALTLTSSRSICRISFSGVNAPTCLSIVVTARDSSTCIVDMATASVGSYWIMVDGHNSSQQMTVTAASLTRRGTVVAVTGTCAKATTTLVTGCSDGSSITIDWTLPSPLALTVGFGASMTMCSEFVVNGTLVICRLVNITTTPHGTHPVYIDGVPTGIAMKVESNVAALMHDVCSGTQTETHAAVPPQHSQPTATSAASIVVGGVVWLGVVLGGAGGAAHSIQSAVLLLRMQTLCSEEFASSSVTPDNLCCDLATSPTQLTISSSHGGVYLGSILGNTLIVVCSTALRFTFGQIIQMQLKTNDKNAEGSSSILIRALRVFGALAPPSGPVTLSWTSYMFLLCPTVALCVALVADEATPSYAQWLGVMIVLMWLVPWAGDSAGCAGGAAQYSSDFVVRLCGDQKKAEAHRTFATRTFVIALATAPSCCSPIIRQCAIGCSLLQKR
ncbi:transmembrane protein, putative [Bodo saltans]|uniref:Transmembrane protein, putative n=1 Tax=Bodo saltans TaxID=75058 RepID=A0A0S4KDZ7_BODSA|nr:transmembrane protein, putative [Bodo saltans]|eukprot:CUI11642.1 transmembrane protein, putative [Bodo saltans]